MSNKRYFWLKLQSNFFDRDDVKLVESMDNGKDYVIFYMKLILKSINSDGKLRFKDTIPYNEKMLSHLTNTNIDIVRSALNVFIELGMMERWDDGTLFMNETANMIGSETSVAQRVRDSRARKAEEDRQPKLLQCNSDETKSNTEIEKELDEELDKELDKEKDIDLDKEEESKTRSNKSTRFNPKNYLIDLGVSEDCAEEFLNHRKAKKATSTKRVIDKLMSESVIAGVSLEQFLDFMVFKGWTSLSAEWYANAHRSNSPQQFNPNKQEALEERNKKVLEEYLAKRGLN